MFILFTFEAIFKLGTLPPLNVCPTSVTALEYSSVISNVIILLRISSFALDLNNKMFSFIVHLGYYEGDKA